MKNISIEWNSNIATTSAAFLNRFLKCLDVAVGWASRFTFTHCTERLGLINYPEMVPTKPMVTTEPNNWKAHSIYTNKLILRKTEHSAFFKSNYCCYEGSENRDRERERE